MTPRIGVLRPRSLPETPARISHQAARAIAQAHDAKRDYLSDPCGEAFDPSLFRHWHARGGPEHALSYRASWTGQCPPACLHQIIPRVPRAPRGQIFRKNGTNHGGHGATRGRRARRIALVAASRTPNHHLTHHHPKSRGKMRARADILFLDRHRFTAGERTRLVAYY